MGELLWGGEGAGLDQDYQRLSDVNSAKSSAKICASITGSYLTLNSARVSARNSSASICASITRSYLT